MAYDTLMFDLLAKDSVSSKLREMSAAAGASAAEMHAAFADPIDVKIKTEGFEEYMAKLDAMKASNQLAIDELSVRNMGLLRDAHAAEMGLGGVGRGAEKLAADVGRASDSIAKDSKSMFSGAFSGGIMSPGGIAAIAGGVAALLPSILSASGALGAAGLSVYGTVHAYEALQTRITSLKTSLATMKPGTASFIRDQSMLNKLLDEQKNKFGPLTAGMGHLRSAWHAFIDDTKGPTQKLLGATLKVAADALRGLTPVAIAADKALTPLMNQLDHWVKSADGKQFFKWLATEGASSITAFGHGIGEAALGILHFAQWMGRLESTIRHSTAFRKFVSQYTSGMKKIGDAIGPLQSAFTDFWHKWGHQITAIGLPMLKSFGDTASSVLYTVAAILELLSGRWSKAWNDIKAASSHGLKGIASNMSSSVPGMNAVWDRFGAQLESSLSQTWSSMVSGAKRKGSELLHYVGGLPGKILAAFGALPGQMLAIGAHIIGSLASGIWNSAQTTLTSVLHDVTNLIPLHKGPIEKDKKLLEPAGRAVIDGLVGGIKQRKKELTKELADVTKKITEINAKIAAAQQFGSAFMGNPFEDVASTRNVKRTVTTRGGLSTALIDGHIVTTRAPGTTTTSTKTVRLSKAQLLADMFAYESKQKHRSHILESQVQKLSREGLSRSLIEQMEAAGPDGLAQIAALASASKSQVKQFNALNAQAVSNYNNAGAYGLSGSSTKHLKDEKHHDQRMEHVIKRALKGTKVQVTTTHLRFV